MFFAVSQFPFAPLALEKLPGPILADKEGSHVVSVLKNLSCRAVRYLLKSLNYYSYNCNLKQLFDFRTLEVWSI